MLSPFVSINMIVHFNEMKSYEICERCREIKIALTLVPAFFVRLWSTKYFLVIMYLGIIFVSPNIKVSMELSTLS